MRLYLCHICGTLRVQGVSPLGYIITKGFYMDKVVSRFFACVTWEAGRGTEQVVPAVFAPFTFPCEKLEGVVWSVFNVEGVDVEALNAELTELINILNEFEVSFTVSRERL